MKRSIILTIILIGIVFAHDMIVRIYTGRKENLALISPKYSLDIAGVRPGEWYDIVADTELLDIIKQSGLTYEVVVHSLALQKERVRANYLSYDQTNDSLRQLAANHPSICKLDSLPIPSYQGNWIYGVKISDDPYLEDDAEAGFLIDGTHHAREWACIPTVLFFADSMLSAYGVVPEITNIINTTEIYCFPIINVDGYLYDYPGANMWRKNREPFGGSIGTDVNRNYIGCGPDLDGGWGAVDQGEAAHTPNDELFCGAYANSGDEGMALRMYVKSHQINANMSYHSYSELLMWGWGWTTQGTPDNALYVQKGNLMANMIQRLSGGYYQAGQIPIILYEVSGGSIDFIYSWCHYVGGLSNLSFTTEIGTQFYQPEGNLDHIIHQNFRALKYLAGFADSIIILTDGMVPPPEIYPLGSVPPNFTIAWHAKNAYDNNPLRWELIELSAPSVIEDDLESGTGRWLLDGYTWSTAQAHSGTHSFWSGNTNSMNSAVQTAHPYLVQSGDSLTFWCRYTLENNYDVTVVEVSENTKEWFCLDNRYTGSTGWVRHAYSLNSWVGRSLYFRFRTMYDGGTASGGFYVDDIYPTCLFGIVNPISSNVTDTTYTFVAHAIGDYYYYIRGENAMWGWGDYSCLKIASVQAVGMPTIPEIVKPLNYARLPDLQPTLSFYASDPQSDDIQYRVFWDENPGFTTPDSATTGTYPSGQVVNFQVPTPLINTETYWWKVKARDPAGSGYWTSFSLARSLTVDSGLPSNTCTWYQTKGAQFSDNLLNGTVVAGDSVILLPSGQTIVDTMLEEHFEGGSIPPGWTVIDGNSDGVEWEVGTTSDIGSYPPPDYGTGYAYYSDDNAGSGSISYNEELISPALAIPSSAQNLDVIYGYGFRVYETGETYEVKARFHNGSAWGGWQTLTTYTSSVSGTRTEDLTSYLPADSVQMEWMYHDESSSSHWGWACACDNVFIRYSYNLANDQGTMTGEPVPFHELSTTYSRTTWGDAIWHKATGGDSIGIQFEYRNGATWQLVPESDLPGNSMGFYSTIAIDTIDIHLLDTLTYHTLRLIGQFYRIGTDSPDDPALLDWEVGNLSNYVGIAEHKEGLTLAPLLKTFPTVFSRKLTIEYCLGPLSPPGSHNSTLHVYNALGQLVRRFALPPEESARHSVITWDGKDDLGRMLSNGIYFVRLDTRDITFTRKVIMLK